MASTSLTVLYDEKCGLCRRAASWLLTQPCLVEVSLLPAGSAEARKRYGTLPWLGSELVVVDQNGDAWIGPAAFLACMWATARYRSWSFALSRPSLAPRAEQFFRWISKRRDRFSRWVATDDAECTWCDEPTGAPPGRKATAAAASYALCANNHLMAEEARFCRVCGSPRPT
jgi:predicted DCC family thiol-disulfide oxidoreductase YuxK